MVPVWPLMLALSFCGLNSSPFSYASCRDSATGGFRFRQPAFANGPADQH